jgi:tetratricopeptide (TPR) repeat protein
MALASIGAAMALTAMLRRFRPAGPPGVARALTLLTCALLIGTRLAAVLEAAAWSTLWNDPLKTYEHNLRTFPYAFDVMIESAKRHAARGDFKQADALAARALHIAPDRNHAYAIRAVMAEREGRVEDALALIKSYRRGMKLVDAWAFGFEADIYADRLGQPERAELLYRAAIATRPWPQDAVRAAESLAVLLASKGRQAEAITLLEEALRYDPTSLRIHHNLACAYRQKGDLEKADHHSRRAKTARAESL